MIGHRNQQHGGAGGQQDPESELPRSRTFVPIHNAGARIVVRCCRAKTIGASGPANPRRESAHQREHHVAAAPRERLLASGQLRLHQKREAHQRQQRAKVRQGKQPVGHFGAGAAYEPGLQKRASGGEQKIRQSDGRGQQKQNASRGIARLRWAPHGVGQNRQQGATPQQQRHMHHHLHASFQEADGDVRVGVSRQQQQLEEEQAGAPHRRRATEPRQNHLGDERLHLKQQEGTQENGNGVEQHSTA